MKIKHTLICMSIIACIITFQTVFAIAQPKFTIVPEIPNSNNVNVPVNGVATVVYQVTNNTKVDRQLTMKLLAKGISQQASGPGVCTNPFSLAASQSCRLVLKINGADVTGGLNDGPEICKTKSSTENIPDPFLCSRPSPANLLRITLVPASLAPISVLNSPLDLTASGSEGILTIKNDSSTVTARNIVATLPSSLSALVTPSGNTCSTIPPGETCQLLFSPPTNADSYIFGTPFDIQGDNTSLVSAIMFVKPPVLGVIGEATPGGWNTDTNMAYDTLNKIFTVTLNLVPGRYKFRQNNTWDVNFGGSNTVPCPTLLYDTGSDLDFTGASGSYTLTVNYATGMCGIS